MNRYRLFCWSDVSFDGCIPAVERKYDLVQSEGIFLNYGTAPPSTRELEPYNLNLKLSVSSSTSTSAIDIWSK
jgi:hypothetical protein